MEWERAGASVAHWWTLAMAAAGGPAGEALEVWMVHPDLGIGGAEMLVGVSGGLRSGG